jgi:beta-lactam-binding protein with PASTA domain
MRIPLALASVVLLLAGCGGTTKPKRVPDLRGQRLDLAEDRLEARGLDWEEIGGGSLGIVIRSHWRVCDQEPMPGRLGRTVKLVVDRECSGRTPEPPVVPDVSRLSLEDANEELDDLGIGHDAETYDDDVPLVEHLWEVCGQDPGPGARTFYVELYVERDCD